MTVNVETAAGFLIMCVASAVWPYRSLTSLPLKSLWLFDTCSTVTDSFPLSGDKYGNANFTHLYIVYGIQHCNSPSTGGWRVIQDVILYSAVCPRQSGIKSSEKG